MYNINEFNNMAVESGEKHDIINIPVFLVYTRAGGNFKYYLVLMA